MTFSIRRTSLPSATHGYGSRKVEAEVADRLVAAASLVKHIRKGFAVDHLPEAGEHLLGAEVVGLHLRSPGYHCIDGKERSIREEHPSRQIHHRGREELPCLIDCSRH